MDTLNNIDTLRESCVTVNFKKTNNNKNPTENPNPRLKANKTSGHWQDNAVWNETSSR